MSRGLWPNAVLCLALLSTGCDIKVGEQGMSVDFALGKATDEWTRSYTIEPGGRLEIVNVNGTIHASPASGGQVEVRAVRELRAGSEDEAREILRTSAMREEVAPDRVVVQPPARPEGEGGHRRPQMVVRYDVRVPAGLVLAFKTQNGEIRVDNVVGQLTASTTNGGITGLALSGSVDASTTNGGIQMDMATLTGDTRLVTVNGGVHLSVPSAIDADLEASAVNGGVSVETGDGLSISETSRQRVTGRFNKGGPRIQLQTTNGGVRVDRRGRPGA